MGRNGASAPPREAVGEDLEGDQGLRYELWIAGDPIPWATGIAPHSHSYVLAKTREWQETVGWQVLSQWSRKPLEGDLGIEFSFFRESWRWVDLWNLVAAMEDALKGILFVDDSQLKVHKSLLRLVKDRPGVKVTVWEMAG